MDVDNTHYLKCIIRVFSLFLSEDANFCMVCKKVSSEAADLTLSAGWEIFCEYTKYYNHISKYGPQEEQVSGCPLMKL